MENQILCGDCLELAKQLDDNSVGIVACSPPYAMQRKNLYGGIPETEYPQWTLNWMNSLKPKLTSDASIFIVIRPHIREGQISDYVLNTRLLVRQAGWIECEELIWYKPDAPPLGSTKRPRRNWESILWFSQTSSPYVDLKACGNAESTRVGGFAGSDRFGEGGSSPIAAHQNRTLSEGTSRCSDVIRVAIGTMDKGVQHPAMYPQGVPEFLVQTFSRPGDLVVDPFSGSGQTALTAKRLGRRYVGFDISEEYCQIARDRLLKS